jgi:hypothetical protein
VDRRPLASGGSVKPPRLWGKVMNFWLIASGIFASMIVAGHCTVGRREFFLPMLDAPFDPIAKRAMTFVWHLSTIALIPPAIALLYAGFVGGDLVPATVAGFIGGLYLLWGAVSLYLGLTSGIEGAMKKLFQWVFFMNVGGLALAGVYMG